MNWIRINPEWLVLRLVALAMQFTVIVAAADAPMPLRITANVVAAAVHIAVILAHHRHIMRAIDAEKPVSK